MNNKPLILFIGNSLFKDDKIGLIIGEKLKPTLENEGFEVELLERIGLTIIDYIQDREYVMIIDSISTSKYPVGEVIEVDVNDFQEYSIWSPHYIGLPETLRLMQALGFNVPRKLYIIGIEVNDVYTISEEISEELARKVEEISAKVYEKVKNLLVD